MTTKKQFLKTHNIVQFDVRYSSADRVYTTPYIHPAFINRIIAVRTLSVQFLKRIKIDESDDLSFRYEFRDKDGNIFIRQKPIIPSYGNNIDEYILRCNEFEYIDASFYIKHLASSMRLLTVNLDRNVESSRILKERRLNMINIRKDLIQTISDVAVNNI